jgi:hypothetical protein
MRDGTAVTQAAGQQAGRHQQSNDDFHIPSLGVDADSAPLV